MEWNYATLKRFKGLCHAAIYKQSGSPNGINPRFADALDDLCFAIDAIPISELPYEMGKSEPRFRLTYDNIRALDRLALIHHSWDVAKACVALRAFF